MPNIRHELLIATPGEKLYNAITTGEAYLPGGRLPLEQNLNYIALRGSVLGLHTLKK